MSNGQSIDDAYEDISAWAGWMSYKEEVLPSDASPVQVLETRRAFYAGCWHMLQMFTGIGEVVDISQEMGCALLERMETELRDFCERVKRGNA